MVATLQALRPPRAMRWVNYWRLITAGLVLLTLLFLLLGVFVRFHWLWYLLAVAPAIGAFYSLGVARHRGRIVGEGSEG